MQEMYIVAFLTRYIDIFLGWESLYLFIIKIMLILVTMYTAYLIKFERPYLLTYNKKSDVFPHYCLYGVALVLTMIVHKSWLPIQLLWNYSIWLESLAVLPQIPMIYH